MLVAPSAARLRYTSWGSRSRREDARRSAQHAPGSLPVPAVKLSPTAAKLRIVRGEAPPSPPPLDGDGAVKGSACSVIEEPRRGTRARG